MSTPWYLTFSLIAILISLFLVLILVNTINKKYLKEIQQLLIYYLTHEQNIEICIELERLLKETEEYIGIKKTKRNKKK